MTASNRTKYQSFEALDIHRSQIKNAPYNPRTIKDKARAGLKKNLKKRGLMTTLVWNKQTGNLVSGHQRLALIDALEGTQDYSITVAVVDIDLKTEKEQNIFFNSTTVQGVFDFNALYDVLEDIDPFAAGLDENDLRIIGFDFEATKFTTDEAKQTVKVIQNFYDPEESDDDSPGANYPDEADRSADYQARKEAVKQQKEKQREVNESRVDEGETYITLSFDTFKAKAAFLRRFDISPDTDYVKGEKISSRIEIVN